MSIPKAQKRKGGVYTKIPDASLFYLLFLLIVNKWKDVVGFEL